jgi:hypothetical protein
LGSGKSTDAWEFALQIAGQLLDNRFTPGFAGLSLYYHASDIPVQTDQFLIDRFERMILRGANTLFYLSQ